MKFTDKFPNTSVVLFLILSVIVFLGVPYLATQIKESPLTYLSAIIISVSVYVTLLKCLLNAEPKSTET